MRAVILFPTLALIFQFNSQTINYNEITLRGFNWQIEPMLKTNGQLELHFMSNTKGAPIVIDKDQKTIFASQNFFTKESSISEFIGFSEEPVNHPTASPRGIVYSNSSS